MQGGGLGCHGLPSTRRSSGGTSSSWYAAAGKTIAQVAKELGLNRETVRCWVRRDQADRSERSDLLSTAERQELARLRRENAELRMEREILKAAPCV